MDLVSLVLYALPAYVANGSPVLFGGGAPVDLGRNFLDGKRLFGRSKTIRGFTTGLISGVAAGIALAAFLPGLFLPQLAFEGKVLVSFLLSFGTLCGDLLGSFVKRRMNLAPGEPFFVTDQLLFIFVALAFSSPVFVPPYADILFLFILTFALHILSNAVAHRLKLKNVPW
jgi:CDP-2,3-bis-(O-geranylgeranyl)-sn-glycerol synthase